MRTMYAPDIVSVEGDGKETAGQDPVIKKSEDWVYDKTFNGETVGGPFFNGANPDQFSASPSKKPVSIPSGTIRSRASSSSTTARIDPISRADWGAKGISRSYGCRARESDSITAMRPTICFLLIWCSVAFAQQPPPKPAFEVAVVRPVDPNSSILVGMSADPAIVRYRNLTLRDAIRGAYKVRDFQIVGPDWMSTVRFEVDAKLPPGANTDQIPEMFQALLEERFKLTFRRETKEMQVYALLAGKDGAKLKPVEKKTDNQPDQPMAMGTDGKPRSVVMFGGSSAGVTITAPSASVLTLVGVTSRFTSQPVVDETGIKGEYDFSLTFAPEDTTSLPGVPPNSPAGASDPAPTLSEAVKKYGLRIESRKASIEMFILTHIEKTPTAN
jgi:uncharacterized protein (TIGR03435 family)